MHSIQWHFLKTQANQHLEYHKVEFCLQPLDIPFSQKMYKSQYMLILWQSQHFTTNSAGSNNSFNHMYEWAINNNLHINTAKTITTFFITDRGENGTTLSLKLNNETLLATKHPKILGTLDQKLTFSQYINVIVTKKTNA